METKELRRFMAKFQRLGECWQWNAGKDSDGYGIFSDAKRKSVRAHRASYLHFIGPIASGLTLDHKCRNRACVNPCHLEPVTVRVNTIRGIGPTAENAKRTHCIRGHEFTPENTYRQKHGRGCLRCRQRRSWSRSARASITRGVPRKEGVPLHKPH